MKILIAYYSMTGNTEAIAKAFKEALAEEEVVLKKVEELDPTSLKLYDLVLIGSGIYAARMHKTVKKILKEATELPKKAALFYTHATQEPETYQPFPKDIRKILEKSGCTICAEFECLGEQKSLSEKEMEQRLQALPPEERVKAEEQMEKLRGHPNTDDLEKAKKFANNLLSLF